MDKRVLIDPAEFAAHLGVNIFRIRRHVAEMKAMGTVERHWLQDRLYIVATPSALKQYWKERRFD
jgi:hypothetical protein